MEKHKSIYKEKKIKKLEGYLSDLKKAKKSLKEADEDSDETKAVSNAIDGVETVIKDLIDNVGASSGAVQELISSVGNLESMQGEVKNEIDAIEEEEETLNTEDEEESEEDEAKDEDDEELDEKKKKKK